MAVDLDFNTARRACHPGPPPNGRSVYWRRWYAEYLRSDEWRERRLKVFERADYLCEGCREAKPTEVHHLTYEMVGYEPLFHLVAVCRDCHEKMHKRRR